MYKNILFATDLIKEHSKHAEKAHTTAKQLHANLYLLHVIEVPTSILVAQGLGFTELSAPSNEDATTVIKLLAESLNIPDNHVFVEVGSVKEHILNKAKELHCDLIIIGSHSNSSLGFTLGGAAHSIVNHATCDVLTLRV